MKSYEAIDAYIKIMSLAVARLHMPLAIAFRVTTGTITWPPSLKPNWLSTVYQARLTPFFWPRLYRDLFFYFDLRSNVVVYELIT